MLHCSVEVIGNALEIFRRVDLNSNNTDTYWILLGVIAVKIHYFFSYYAVHR